ncbi:MAG: glycosyltransferase family 4 protein [Flavobacteriaceae bacterium]|nr:glycosyltransferase family 4 protein [Flavobacteriaceae bacterium]
MKDYKRNILIVSSEFPPQPGGIGNHAFNLACYLSKNDYRVEVLTDERDPGSEDREFDAKLDFKVNRIKCRDWRFIMYFKRVILLFRLIKHANTVIASGKFSLWQVALASFFYRRHYIAVIHGTEVNFRNAILKSTINFALKRMDDIIAVSHYTKSLVSKLNLKSVKVIPNGFDTNDWNNNDREDIDLKGDPKLITVGNVSRRKGQLNVIKHLSHLIKIYPDAHYHCVGIPTEKEPFLNTAKNLKIEEHITFHGRVKHDKLNSFLKASDIFIMLSSPTSSGDVEGFGIAILEANYCGVPAIGSLNCGIEDAIEHNSSGLLINHGETDEFIEAVNTIMKNKEDFCRNSKLWATNFSWDHVIKSYIEVLDKK